MIRASIILAFALAAPSVIAQQPPLEIKGLALGLTEEQLHSRLPGAFECKTHENIGRACYSSVHTEPAGCRSLRRLPSQQCNAAERELYEFGPITPTIYAVNFDSDGRAGRMSVGFNTADYLPLSAALVAKYGAPTSDENRAVKNRMGAEFDNRTLVWRRPDGVMTLQQRAGSVDRGNLVIMAVGFVERTSGDQAEKAKAAAKKL